MLFLGRMSILASMPDWLLCYSTSRLNECVSDLHIPCLYLMKVPYDELW